MIASPSHHFIKSSISILMKLRHPKHLIARPPVHIAKFNLSHTGFLAIMLDYLDQIKALRKMALKLREPYTQIYNKSLSSMYILLRMYMLQYLTDGYTFYLDTCFFSESGSAYIFSSFCWCTWIIVVLDHPSVIGT